MKIHVIPKKNIYGFTLIEILIYVVIAAFILTAMSAFVFRLIEDRNRTFVQREVQQNTRFALEKITRAIRNAAAITSPVEGATSTSLSLTMDDPNLDPTIFDLNGLILQVQEGSNGPEPLTSEQSLVTNLVFRDLSYADTPGIVGIEMTITYNNPSSRSEYDAKVSIASSASLRKGSGTEVFTTYPSQDLGGKFASSANALSSPDSQYASGKFDKEDDHDWGGFSDGGNTGTIIKVELIFTGYIDKVLPDDQAEITLKTPTQGTLHPISNSEFNQYVGSANAGDIILDVTQDQTWTFSEIASSTIEPLKLLKVGGGDKVKYFLDSIGLRVTYQP